MKLAYVANARIPTEKAHGLQIMKMCEQFAKRADAELVVPRRLNPIKDDPFIYYGVNKGFKIKHLPVLDLVKLGRVGFWIESLFFSLAALIYLASKKTDIIYGRDEAPLYFLSFFKKNIFWEAHQGRMNIAVKRLLKKSAGVITISNGLKEFYKEKRSDIWISPDAVDFDAFNVSLSKEECRRKLNLPPDKKIVLYSGHLYEWKGADLLLEAAKQHPTFNNQHSVLFVFVGGTEEDILKFKIKSSKLKNVLVVGRRPHQEIPLWLKASDILILPNSAKEEISRSFTSPMKLFEYMASGAPIIASDLPSIREIVGEKDALFFKADDAQDLADKIKYVFEHEAEARAKAGSARQKVQNYTWRNRAENILNFIAQKQGVAEKSDFWPALIAGAGIAVLSGPVLKNLGFFNYLSFFLLFFFVPSAAVIGISIAQKISVRYPIVKQLAKYGLVGWLNVSIYAGVFNLLSWISGIAKGLIADAFVVVAFIITITNAFFWNKLWTFQAKGSGEGGKEYIKFFMVTGFTTVLNTIIFHAIINVLGAPAGLDEKIWANVAIVFAIPVSFVGNFFGYRFFVFKNKK